MINSIPFLSRMIMDWQGKIHDWFGVEVVQHLQLSPCNACTCSSTCVYVFVHQDCFHDKIRYYQARFAIMPRGPSFVSCLHLMFKRQTRPPGLFAHLAELALPSSRGGLCCGGVIMVHIPMSCVVRNLAFASALGPLAAALSTPLNCPCVRVLLTM
ncbi:hypothetical protein BD289DRAFT_157351 [Coniella lustricola]|uniref:Uncharacterized protein n=1 Tax=Coniella lustricola TaxID=2025994 RepID=A0A2T3AML9_9PEZI|nr:hypothetical protein BD289DRAFT_157351 [Coniella lustricola]